MIRHPNYSGMQMDQLTRLYVPAHFVKSVRIWQGQDLLLAIESGISMSENPIFRFDYRPNGATSFSAEMEDSDGGSFAAGVARDVQPDRRVQKQRTSASAWASSRSRTISLVAAPRNVWARYPPAERRMRSTVSAFSYWS